MTVSHHAGVAAAAPEPSRRPAAPDMTAPVASFTGLRTGQVFSRRKARRGAPGTVSPDPSGLKSVRLSIIAR